MFQANGALDAPIEPLIFRPFLQGQGELQPQPCADTVPCDMEIDLDGIIREAFERGQAETMSAMKADMEQRLARERDAVSRALQQFEQERHQYFAGVEAEVVKLSLAIAERVLRREAAMDSTLLAGAARVALEQVRDTSEATLHIAAADAAYWDAATVPALRTIRIALDDALQQGEALLETSSGRVQLGMKAQLDEIERGFFELMRCRPTGQDGGA